MTDDLNTLDGRLLNNFQRGVPVIATPFAAMAATLEVSEADVITRLKALQHRGAITRFGATCRPNTAGASTLAAIAAPAWDVEETAAVINRQAGVNHSYLREDHWNLWFVVTGPDRAHIDAVLAQIHDETGLQVLNLPLVEPFNIDLGFDLGGARAGTPVQHKAAPTRALEPVERAVLQGLSTGLALEPRPFARLAEHCGLSEAAAVTCAADLLEEGFLTRFGVIVRHRALGWRANAMVVWQVSPEAASAIGPELARVPGVTLCYRRQAVPDVWPYTLYNMIHGRTREEALAVLDVVRAMPGLTNAPHRVLFSLRCFRQTGALIDTQSMGAEHV